MLLALLSGSAAISDAVGNLLKNQLSEYTAERPLETFARLLQVTLKDDDTSEKGRPVTEMDLNVPNGTGLDPKIVTEEVAETKDRVAVTFEAAAA